MATEVKKNIYQRLNGFLKLGLAVPKTGKMSGSGGTFSFHETDEVLAFLRPHMAEHGIVFTHTVEKHTLDSFKTAGGKDSRQTVKAVRCRLVNVDNPEDFIECVEYGYGLDSQDKGPGKASSYAIKTFLINIFCLRGQPNENKVERFDQPISEPQADVLTALIKKSGANQERFLNAAGVASVYNVLESKYTTMKRLLEDMCEDAAKGQPAKSTEESKPADNAKPDLKIHKESTEKTPESVDLAEAVAKSLKTTRSVKGVESRKVDLLKLCTTEQEREMVVEACNVPRGN